MSVEALAFLGLFVFWLVSEFWLLVLASIAFKKGNVDDTVEFLVFWTITSIIGAAVFVTWSYQMSLRSVVLFGN